MAYFNNKTKLNKFLILNPVGTTNNSQIRNIYNEK